MHTHRVIYYAAAGKVQELGRLLQARHKQLHNGGVRSVLHAGIYTTDGASFVTAIQFDGLAALDSFRQGEFATTSPASQTVLGGLPSLLRAPPKVELWQHIMAANAATPPRYVSRVSRQAMPGKTPQLRMYLEELATSFAAMGARPYLGIQSAGPATGTLTLGNVHDSMAQYEADWSRLGAEPANQRLIELAAGVQAANAAWELFEVVVPIT